MKHYLQWIVLAVASFVNRFKFAAEKTQNQVKVPASSSVFPGRHTQAQSFFSYFKSVWIIFYYYSPILMWPLLLLYKPNKIKRAVIQAGQLSVAAPWASPYCWSCIIERHCGHLASRGQSRVNRRRWSVLSSAAGNTMLLNVWVISSGRYVAVHLLVLFPMKPDCNFWPD